MLIVSVMKRYYVVHELRIIGFGPSFTHLGVTVTSIQIIGQQNYTRPLSNVLIILFGRLTRLYQQGRYYIIEQLTRPLIEADTCSAGPGLLIIKREYILQFSQVFSIYLSDAPLLFKPGLEFAFFKDKRTDS